MGFSNDVSAINGALIASNDSIVHMHATDGHVLSAALSQLRMVIELIGEHSRHGCHGAIGHRCQRTNHAAAG
jgi:predicted regulator of Ras-like GTPase activity (Roadblock/LC7/MglB family)